MVEVDQHVFGESDYLNGNDYEPGDLVRVKATSFLGRQEYTTREGDKERAGYYKVDRGDGRPKEFRLGIQNEVLLAKKFGCKSYEDAVGGTMTLKVRGYNFGNGFVLVKFEKTPNGQAAQQHGLGGSK